MSLCNSLDPGHLIPRLESALESGTIFPCTQAVTSRLEMPSDGTEGGEKALGVFC